MAYARIPSRFLCVFIVEQAQVNDRLCCNAASGMPNRPIRQHETQYARSAWGKKSFIGFSTRSLDVLSVRDSEQRHGHAIKNVAR